MTDFDEQPLIERLRAEAHRGVVTDRDVADAHVRLRARLAQPEPVRRRPGVSAVAAVAAAVAVVVTLILATLPGDRGTPAPEPGPVTQRLDPDAVKLSEREFLDGATPTMAQLVGLWHLRSSEEARIMAIGPGGQMRASRGKMTVPEDANLMTNPGAAGAYTLQGDSLVLHVSRRGCPDGTSTVTSRAALMPDGSLHLVTTSDTSTSTDPACRAERRSVWDRLERGSALLGLLQPKDDWVRPTLVWANVDPGLYVTKDGSWTMQINADRTYEAYRGEDLSRAPAESGTILRDAEGPGILTLTCRGGQVRSDVRLTLSDGVPGVVAPTVWFVGAVTQNGCASGFGVGEWEWLRLLPKSTRMILDY